MFGKGNDGLIIVQVWGIVWAVGESIGTVQCTRSVDKFDVVLFMLCEVSGDSGANLMQMTEELEVGVISDDEDGMCCAF